MFEVLESTRFVARESRLVRIDKRALWAFAGRLSREDFSLPPWDSMHHYTGPKHKVTAYLLVLDTINFCFRPPDGHEAWETNIDGCGVSGYNGLAAALKKAMEDGVPLVEAAFLAGLSVEDLEGILRGRGRLQLMEERALALRELGSVLLRDYGGQAHLLVEATVGWAGDLARLLAGKLASFRDTAVYRGRAVYFYKRGQILAADLHGALEGLAWGWFRDMDRLTAFADYKLPQVLRQWGVLVYEKDLALRVDRQEPIEAGSEEEIEIRSNTIVAVEMIRQAVMEMGKRLQSFEIDGILWQMGQDDKYRLQPYHRTTTIFY